MLSGKKIVLGVSGGIAAYKSAFLVRLLVREGAEVRVVMTPAARDFVTPLTLSTLSANPVRSSFFDETDQDGLWHNHVELGLWADLMLVAPATANTLSKMASGNCDNFLIAVYLSAKCPVYVAPAMDLDMYKHASTEQSFTALEGFGNKIIAAETGELASGLYGQGRMAEPENIVAFLKNDLESRLPLRGKSVLITAGPTYEAIDPVRFIGNHSSGKMGYALALKAAELGASVTLVSGPTHLNAVHDNISIQRVSSAQQMFDACNAVYDGCDVAICAAAVADYRPVEAASQKIKKSDATLEITLEKTPDILAHLGANKKHQYLVGFALETNNEIEHASDKIRKKNLDLIVLNSMRDAGAGFGGDTNKVTLIDREFRQIEFGLKSKSDVAADILNQVVLHYA